MQVPTIYKVNKIIDVIQSAAKDKEEEERIFKMLQLYIQQKKGA